MAILDLVTWPDKRLTEISEEVSEVNDATRKLMDDMLETMHFNNGIGLAAVQVGVLKRLFVMEISSNNERYPDSKNNKTKPLYIVNPKIVSVNAEEQVYKEGCLSFPGQFSDVIRPKSIKLEYQDYYGKKQIMEADGLLAICIQHEIDHLNGIVFVDHISKLKKDRILKKLTNRKTENV